MTVGRVACAAVPSVPSLDCRKAVDERDVVLLAVVAIPAPDVVASNDRATCNCCES